MPEPQTATELRAYVESYANLIYNIGTIIEDREAGIELEGARVPRPQDLDDDVEFAEREHRLWLYLYEHIDDLYERIGPIIDEVQDAVSGKEDYE